MKKGGGKKHVNKNKIFVTIIMVSLSCKQQFPMVEDLK